MYVPDNPEENQDEVVGAQGLRSFGYAPGKSMFPGIGELNLGQNLPNEAVPVNVPVRRLVPGATIASWQTRSAEPQPQSPQGIGHRILGLGQEQGPSWRQTNQQRNVSGPKLGIGQRILGITGGQAGLLGASRPALLPNATSADWGSHPEPLPYLKPDQAQRPQPLTTTLPMIGFNDGQHYGGFFSTFVPPGTNMSGPESLPATGHGRNAAIGANQSSSNPAFTKTALTSGGSAVAPHPTPQNRSGDSPNPAKQNSTKNGPGLNQHGYIPASPEDIAQGNYIKVGFRHLLRFPKFAYHSYVQIPVIGNDGKPTGGLEKWGVLGNPDSSENQQVRNDEIRNNKGHEILVKVTPEQREALRQRMQYFSEQDPKTKQFLHPCPVCGPNYHKLKQNSNTFVYNMLFWNPAGMIWAPKPPRWTVKYGVNLGNRGWYK
jgi:hypothetical protein